MAIAAGSGLGGQFREACQDLGLGGQASQLTAVMENRLPSTTKPQSGGGFRAVVRETGEPHRSHICYIRSIRCYADEARFGGIVIQILEKK